MHTTKASIKPFTLMLSIVGGLFLTSCATLSKEECTMGNWQMIGYNDGVSGHYMNRLASHTKACAKVGVTPDYEAWERGRTLGLKKYCTVSNAYNIGRRGQSLNNVCPADSVNNLQMVNQQGLDYYTLSQQIEEDRKLLEAYQTEYNQLRDGEMLTFKNETEARARLVKLPVEFRKLKRRIDSNERQIQSLNKIHHD